MTSVEIKIYTKILEELNVAGKVSLVEIENIKTHFEINGILAKQMIKSLSLQK